MSFILEISFRHFLVLFPPSALQMSPFEYYIQHLPHPPLRAPNKSDPPWK